MLGGSHVLNCGPERPESMLHLAFSYKMVGRKGSWINSIAPCRHAHADLLVTANLQVNPDDMRLTSHMVPLLQVFSELLEVWLNRV